MLYEDGEGVTKNYKTAAEYYEQAVELGDSSSLENLADLYEKGGFGLKKDLRKSKEYRTQYAEQ